MEVDLRLRLRKCSFLIHRMSVYDCFFCNIGSFDPLCVRSPLDTLESGVYSISGGCRNSYLFYTTVHHGK